MEIHSGLVKDYLRMPYKSGAVGAAMTLVHNARNSTNDIDAISSPTEDLRSIIGSIAESYGLRTCGQ